MGAAGHLRGQCGDRCGQMFHKQPASSFEEVLGINLLGSVGLARAAMAVMRRPGTGGSSWMMPSTSSGAESPMRRARVMRAVIALSQGGKKTNRLDRGLVAILITRLGTDIC
jgi:NAD(P)-dependent dehydrogenase (short-subunit alcohol dehydrogenase family)